MLCCLNFLEELSLYRKGSRAQQNLAGIERISEAQDSLKIGTYADGVSFAVSEPDIPSPFREPPIRRVGRWVDGTLWPSQAVRPRRRPFQVRRSSQQLPRRLLLVIAAGQRHVNEFAQGLSVGMPFLCRP